MTESATDPSSHSIGVVVVAYRSSGQIDACLGAIAQDPAVRIAVVVDNSRDPETRVRVAKHSASDPRIRYVDPGANIGFAAGCNLGARTASEYAEVLAFVNPDVTLTRGLGGLAKLLGEHGAAVAAGRLVGAGSAPQPEVLSNAHPLPTFRRELRRAVLGSSRDTAIPLRHETAHVGQLDGALLVVNRHVFWRLGGFDERFELYYEDVDFCRTARTLGGCVISSTTWGVHEGGASFRSDPWPAFAVLRISRLRYFRKVGIGLLPGPAHLALSVLELAARTVTRRPEGHRARWSSLRVQARELRRPGSIWLLSAHDNPAARASLESSAGVPAVLSSQVRDTKST